MDCVDIFVVIVKLRCCRKTIFHTKFVAILYTMIYLCIIIDNLLIIKTAMEGVKLSYVLTVKSYAETLRSFAVGETRFYELAHTDYTGFHNARKRLQDSKWGLFTFEKHYDSERKLFKITRTE